MDKDLEREIDAAERQPVRRRAGKGKKEFRKAIGVSAGEAAKAAGKSTYKGNYWARTLRLPPEYRDIVLGIFKQEPRAKSIADLERWIFAKGIEAYMNGERPEYTEAIERAIELPDFGGG